MTPLLQQALRMLGSDHRELIAMIDAALANPGLIRLEPPAPVGEADLALALEPDRAWVEVAFQGRYEASDPQAVFFVRCLERRAETVGKIVRALAEHHRARLEGTGPTEPLQIAALAEHLDVHPSNVSRVLGGKTIRFDRADHPLAELLPYR